MTYTEFVERMVGVQVVGVQRRFGAPPNQLSSADLPAQWPRLPDGDSEIATFGDEMGLDTLRCDLVVCVEAVGQNTQPINYARCLQLVDGLQAALTTAARTDNVIDRWTLRLQAEMVGTTGYWLLVASVTGSD